MAAANGRVILHSHYWLLLFFPLQGDKVTLVCFSCDIRREKTATWSTGQGCIIISIEIQTWLETLTCQSPHNAKVKVMERNVLSKMPLHVRIKRETPTWGLVESVCLAAIAHWRQPVVTLCPPSFVLLLAFKWTRLPPLTYTERISGKRAVFCLTIRRGKHFHFKADEVKEWLKDRGKSTRFRWRVAAQTTVMRRSLVYLENVITFNDTLMSKWFNRSIANDYQKTKILTVYDCCQTGILDLLSYSVSWILFRKILWLGLNHYIVCNSSYKCTCVMYCK